MTEPKHIRTACQNCSLSPLCLPVSLSFSEMERLDAIIERGQAIAPGRHLYRQGDAMHSIFAIRSGSVKTFTLTRNGDEQITGFHVPSEVIALASFDLPEHQNTAVALETTHVCEIPLSQLERLSGQLPELRRQILRTMSREIREDQHMMLLLSHKTAEERLASFLLGMAQRFRRRGFSERRFHLSMSRADLANYLGLAVETVSRQFTRFQHLGLIQLQGAGRDVAITHYPRLCATAALSSLESQNLGLIPTTDWKVS